MITRDGRETVVVMSAKQWNLEVRREGTLADFFAASPLKGSGLVVERPSEAPRDIEL